VKSAKKGPTLSMVNQDRIIFLLIFVTVAVPMIAPLGLPIPVSPTTAKFFDTVEDIPEGSTVLWCTGIGLSIWYNTGPGEIAALKHIIGLVRERSVKLIVFAQSAEGATIVRRILTEYLDLGGLTYGEDYVDLGWIPGGEAALAGVVADFQSTVETDHAGTPASEIPMLIEISGGDDFDVLGFSSGGMIDAWMRQWAPLKKPILLNIIAISVPLCMPYIDKGMVTAYLNGQRGGAEYEKLLMQPGMGTSFIDAQSMIHLYIVAMIAVVSIWSLGRRVKGQ
jgi:hypothetical protein